MKSVKMVAFDEADEMWSRDGRACDSLKLLRTLRHGGSNYVVLCFAATCNDGARSIIQRVLGARANHVCVRGSEAPPPPKQLWLECSDEAANLAALLRLVAQSAGQTLVFLRSHGTAEQLQVALAEAGHTCVAYSSSYDERAVSDAAVRSFRDGATQVLVTTDVLSRVFVVPGISLVVSFVLSVCADLHLHRVGRCARVGRSGIAVSLVCGEAESAALSAIAERLGIAIPAVTQEEAEVALLLT
jgi:superfamily II DNA/RNA helicase